MILATNTGSFLNWQASRRIPGSLPGHTEQSEAQFTPLLHRLLG
jgi:hypothetical protein